MRSRSGQRAGSPVAGVHVETDAGESGGSLSGREFATSPAVWAKSSRQDLCAIVRADPVSAGSKREFGRGGRTRTRDRWISENVDLEISAKVPPVAHALLLRPDKLGIGSDGGREVAHTRCEAYADLQKPRPAFRFSTEGVRFTRSGRRRRAWRRRLRHARRAGRRRTLRGPNCAPTG